MIVQIIKTSENIVARNTCERGNVVLLAPLMLEYSEHPPSNKMSHVAERVMQRRAEMNHVRHLVMDVAIRRKYFQQRVSPLPKLCGGCASPLAQKHVFLRDPIVRVEWDS
jgi:hypothetical protein